MCQYDYCSGGVGLWTTVQLMIHKQHRHLTRVRQREQMKTHDKIRVVVIDTGVYRA